MSNYDPIDTCPYDPAHRIMRSRMQYHLMRCAKNWPCAKKKQCPYDARHVVNQIEYNYHISTCSQRDSLLRYKIEEIKEIENKSTILPIDAIPAEVVQDEVWEEEVKVKSYNPIRQSENRPITRILIGASKSERKRHRIQERLRIARLEDVQKSEANKLPATKNKSNQRATTPIQPIIPEKTFKEAQKEYQPLRFPNEVPLDNSKLSNFSIENDSVAVNQTQNTVQQNKHIQGKSNTKENLNLQPEATFSYASAAKKVPTSRQRNNSNGSDCDVIFESTSVTKKIPTNLSQRISSNDSEYDVIVDILKLNNEKENNSSLFNNSIDKNLVQETKTVEELTIDDEGFKKQSEFFNRTLESLKNVKKYSSVLKKQSSDTLDRILESSNQTEKYALVEPLKNTEKYTPPTINYASVIINGISKNNNKMKSETHNKNMESLNQTEKYSSVESLKNTEIDILPICNYSLAIRSGINNGKKINPETLNKTTEFLTTKEKYPLMHNYSSTMSNSINNSNKMQSQTFDRTLESFQNTGTLPICNYSSAIRKGVNNSSNIQSAAVNKKLESLQISEEDVLPKSKSLSVINNGISNSNMGSESFTRTLESSQNTEKDTIPMLNYASAINKEIINSNKMRSETHSRAESFQNTDTLPMRKYSSATSNSVHCNKMQSETLTRITKLLSTTETEEPLIHNYSSAISSGLNNTSSKTLKSAQYTEKYTLPVQDLRTSSNYSSGVFSEINSINFTKDNNYNILTTERRSLRSASKLQFTNLKQYLEGK